MNVLTDGKQSNPESQLYKKIEGCAFLMDRVEDRVKQMLKKKPIFNFMRRARSPQVGTRISTREKLLREFKSVERENPLTKMFKIQSNLRSIPC